jgi:hypothetical protein
MKTWSMIIIYYLSQRIIIRLADDSYIRNVPTDNFNITVELLELVYNNVITVSGSIHQICIKAAK